MARSRRRSTNRSTRSSPGAASQPAGGGPLVALTAMAAPDAESIPDQSLVALEEYEPPALTPQRLEALAARRAAVAAAGVPAGLRGAAAARTRAAVTAALEAAALPPVAIEYNTSLRVWRVVNNYSYTYNGHTLTAKAGYSFDLASIPRPLWWLIAPNELSIIAPLFHDMLYEFRGRLPDTSFVNPYRTYTRREADDLFLHLMEVEGVDRWRRLSAYSAVRAAGRLFWND